MYSDSSTSKTMLFSSKNEVNLATDKGFEELIFWLDLVDRFSSASKDTPNEPVEIFVARASSSSLFPADFATPLFIDSADTLLGSRFLVDKSKNESIDPKSSSDAFKISLDETLFDINAFFLFKPSLDAETKANSSSDITLAVGLMFLL